MQLFTTIPPLNRSPTRHTAFHDPPDNNIPIPKPVLQHLKHLDGLPLHCMPLRAQSKLGSAKGPLAISRHSWNSEDVKRHLRQLWKPNLITDPPFNRIDVGPNLRFVVPVDLVLAILFIRTGTVVDKGLVGIVPRPKSRRTDRPWGWGSSELQYQRSKHSLRPSFAATSHSCYSGSLHRRRSHRRPKFGSRMIAAVNRGESASFV